MCERAMVKPGTIINTSIYRSLVRKFELAFAVNAGKFCVGTATADCVRNETSLQFSASMYLSLHCGRHSFS